MVAVPGGPFDVGVGHDCQPLLEPRSVLAQVVPQPGTTGVVRRPEEAANYAGEFGDGFGVFAEWMCPPLRVLWSGPKVRSWATDILLSSEMVEEVFCSRSERNASSVVVEIFRRFSSATCRHPAAAVAGDRRHACRGQGNWGRGGTTTWV